MSEQSANPNYELEENYALFRHLTDAYANNSPQNQGLTPEEFMFALSDPEVITTSIDHAGKIYEIPQLSPVASNQWLNDGFYTGRFPRQAESGNLLHFVDIPGLEVGSRIKSRLLELASNEGVVVFDYPESDHGYPDRLTDMLSELGVEYGEVEELGMQTYFAGQTTLLKDFKRTNPIIQQINETFADLRSAGDYDDARLLNGASVQAIVDKEDAKHMLSFYDQAYEVLNDDPCRQGLDPEEFMQMLTQDETVSKLVRTVNGKIAALCLLENDLTRLSWVNAGYYQQKFPDKYNAGQVVYFPGLAADPEGDVGSNTQIMVNLIAELGYKACNDMLVVFDSCQKNTGFLDAFLEAMINKTPHARIKIEKIAAQRYCAVRTSLKQ